MQPKLSQQFVLCWSLVCFEVLVVVVFFYVWENKLPKSLQVKVLNQLFSVLLGVYERKSGFGTTVKIVLTMVVVKFRDGIWSWREAVGVTVRAQSPFNDCGGKNVYIDVFGWWSERMLTRWTDGLVEWIKNEWKGDCLCLRGWGGGVEWFFFCLKIVLFVWRKKRNAARSRGCFLFKFGKKEKRNICCCGIWMEKKEGVKRLSCDRAVVLLFFVCVVRFERKKEWDNLFVFVCLFVRWKNEKK